MMTSFAPTSIFAGFSGRTFSSFFSSSAGFSSATGAAGKFLKLLITAEARGELQGGNGLGVPRVGDAVLAIGELPYVGQEFAERGGLNRGLRGEGGAVEAQGIVRHLFQAYAADARLLRAEIRKSNGRLPAPPHDESGHTWHHADSVLMEITRNGLVPGVTAPEGYVSDMPAYSKLLSDHQIRAVLADIKSSWSKQARDRQKQITQQ